MQALRARKTPIVKNAIYSNERRLGKLDSRRKELIDSLQLMSSLMLSFTMDASYFLQLLCSLSFHLCSLLWILSGYEMIS